MGSAGLTFEKDTTGTVCLCSMKSGAWAGGSNHLKVSSLTRLGTDIDQDLRWSIGWDICSRPSRGYWASPQHDSWVLRAGVPREQGRSTCHFNDPSEKSLGIISTIVLVEAITKIHPGSRARDMGPTTQQEGCQGHMVRRYGMEDIVGTIFGKYNLPLGARETNPRRWELPLFLSDCWLSSYYRCGQHQWRPDQPVMLIWLYAGLGINQTEWRYREHNFID